MNYLYLAIAIVSEVIGTTFLARSEGFARPLPTAAALAAYAVAFYGLSLTLRTIPAGIAYAIWSGVGIVLIGVEASALNRQKTAAPARIGMGVTVAVVAVVNLVSMSAPHIPQHCRTRLR